MAGEYQLATLADAVDIEEDSSSLPLSPPPSLANGHHQKQSPSDFDARPSSPADRPRQSLVWSHPRAAFFQEASQVILPSFGKRYLTSVLFQSIREEAEPNCLLVSRSFGSILAEGGGSISSPIAWLVGKLEEFQGCRIRVLDLELIRVG